jgi:predicted RNA binding protein YcfA (HicA-like mRNA interferase family)
MTMRVRDLIRKLKADGWYLARVRGSHHHFAHSTKPGIVTIAYDQESDDMPAGTLNSIFKQAGWK